MNGEKCRRWNGIPARQPLAPNRNVLFNIARTYERMKRLPDAYRYYLQALDGETRTDIRQKVQQSLDRIRPLVAVLRVQTNPPGATVYLDRKDLGARGKSPDVIGLDAGRHRVFVELAGHEPATSDLVDLRVGSESVVQLSLRPIVTEVRLEADPSAAAVRLDSDKGPALCQLPCSLSVPPGPHLFLLAKEGYQPLELSVEVPATGPLVLRPKLVRESGTLIVNTDVRDALVTLDGEPRGFTPLVTKVPVGKHRLRVVLSGFRVIEQPVEVHVGQQTQLELQLTQSEEVTAASRVSESTEDAPASVSIVSSQELRAMGYPTLAEALRGIRGMYLSDDRSYVTAGIRGFSRPGDYGNRILVLVDGHPTNDNYIWSSYMGFDLRVDLEDIERIEVVRGPGSVLYGTSAFFGVINLVTRHRDEPTHTEAGVSTAEYGVFRARAASVLKTAHVGAWISASYAHATGRDFTFPEYQGDATDPNVERGYGGFPVNGLARAVDGFEAGTVTGRVTYKALTAQFLWNSRTKKIPTGIYGTIFNDPNNTFTDIHGFGEVRFEPQITRDLQWLSRGHINISDFRSVGMYPAPDGPSYDSFRGRWAGLEQRFVYAPSSALRLTLGGEAIRHFQARQVGYNSQGHYITDSAGNAGRDDPFSVVAGYVLGDFVPTPAFKISAGARLDYLSNLDSFDLAASINPRLAFIVKPYEGGNLKIMGGKAFRAPSVYELYYRSTTQEISAGLRPEQIYSGEIEFTHRFSSTVSAVLAGYVNVVKDLIELRDLSDYRTQYANAGALVRAMGTEFEMRRDWRQGWMLSASYSYQNVQYVNDPTLREVPNAPSHLASFRGAFPILGRTLMGMTRLTVEGPRADRNVRVTDPPQGTTDWAAIWDLVLSGEVERMGVRYNVGLYNVANWRYDAVLSGEFRQRTIVQNGRTVLASLSTWF